MTHSRMLRSTSLALGAAAALIALSACSPTGSGSTDHPHSLIDADCVPGDWTNDIQTLAQETADALPEDFDVVGIVSDGTQKYHFTADGNVTIVNDFTIDISVDRDGHTIETAQKHHGTVTATWALDGTEMTMTGVDEGDYTITTTVTVDGQGGSGTTTPPGESDSLGTALDAVCRGNGMTLAPQIAEDLVSHLSRVE